MRVGYLGLGVLAEPCSDRPRDSRTPTHSKTVWVCLDTSMMHVLVSRNPEDGVLTGVSAVYTICFAQLSLTAAAQDQNLGR